MLDFMLNCIYVGIGLSGLAAMAFMSMVVITASVKNILFNIWLVRFDKFLEDQGIKDCIDEYKKRVLIREAVNSTYQKALDKQLQKKPAVIATVEKNLEDDEPVILKLHG